MRYLLLFVLALFLISGAQLGDVEIKGNLSKLNRIENENFQVIVDYNKIKKTASSFKFFPVYFYLSKDDCYTPVEKIKKEDVIDVDICIGFNVIDDFHHIRLELITPDDAVYQNINIFTDRGESSFQKIKYNGDFTPYNISKPIILRETYFIKSSIPVAGSSIQTQNLTGKWKINLFIDDLANLSGTTYFEIE